MYSLVFVDKAEVRVSPGVGQDLVPFVGEAHIKLLGEFEVTFFALLDGDIITETVAHRVDRLEG